ncbi:ATP-dependent helicase HrpB [Pseudoxanthomonas wuyuanensis]|uniref:ATP-dependent helicase HrpB n=1 Tax=Pseudoxanthomonas wuyuanensis TaxID=1073196 RepID=A0A286DEM4_9GAMM|nr:ATP-dependent helicase HrpB [Pseudoxanthomonas wuyuanensis]SOD57083.1 ATP-dependent helicase HrpB [Pseudoxanthomonas wuyuanensis]
MILPSFPIQVLLPQIRSSLAAHPRLVLEAPPGAGKTTQVPLALLDEAWLDGRRIVMLEPRRVAARAAAGFMAGQLNQAVGETVGYRIRFDNKVTARTRIEVVTEGILTRMIQDDPMLEGVGAILFDEFHERHLSADLGLALALDVQSQLREDLRIVAMSATLDGEKLARFLDAPRLSSEGRSYPVEIAHFPARRDEPLELQTRRAIEHALQQHPGDVLVFLPGQREIARVQAALQPPPPPRQGRVWEGQIVVLPLHGELPVEKQAEVLQPDPHGHRRVVLATNVAESSVTLPGVRVVIDAGLAREPRYDPNSGFSRLEVVSISRASADQRAGRAGRVAEGWAYRLWPQSQRLEPQRRPEMAQVELASLALELAAWGSDALRFVDPPPAGALAAARDLLQRLGGLGLSGAITPLGKRMLALGTHPRLAAMLLSAPNGEDRALACDLAALIEARDPLRSGGDALTARWRALAAFRSGRAPGDANRSGLAAIDTAARQWRRRLRTDATPPADIEAHRLGDLLMHAFPDRIAHQHPADPRRYQLANGRMARLFDDSAVFGEPWLVASELRHEAKDALIQRAAPVDEAALRRQFGDRFVSEDAVRWDAGKRALVAQRESRFDQIVLESKPAGRVDPERAAVALTDAVRELGLSALSWSEPLQQWLERVRSLREWMPELELPDLSEDALLATLDDWLLPAFSGKTRLDALDEDTLSHAVKSSLEWSLRQRIDQLAPTRITVPSGMERRIEYAHGQSPVLAVKLQELFGLADTPRIADGRVPLTLHLLSPGGRPLQVTQDLRGFWERTYPEVKKEMKGRYPKHPWPDDPWTAQATHRAKPRGT